jgi:hypothetical protein
LARGLAVLCLCIAGSGSAAKAAECPNEGLRSGPSAHLPDCRAYELVTPDSDGRLIGAINTFGLPPFQETLLPSELASPARDSIAYFSYQSALPFPRGATGVADLYDAERGSGWQTTRLLTPAGSSAVQVRPSGVSPDHLYSVSVAGGGPGPLVVEGRPTAYLGKPDGSFELLGSGTLGSEPYAQVRYLGEAGEHIVFSTGADISQSVWCSGNPKCKVRQLEPTAPPTGIGAIYDRSADGPTQVVSLLPGDATPAAQAFYRGTAKDGSATAFEIEGTLYVRLDNAETVEVATGSPTFAGLSDDGHYVFYVDEGSGGAGNVHRFDTTTEEDVEVNVSGDGEIVNVSGDGSHVYFISPSQLDGVKGAADQPNLYVWSGGASEYVTTVAPSDLERTSGALGVPIPALTRWTSAVTNLPTGPLQGVEQGPGNDSSRTTPDGTVLVFESRSQLTPYDNDHHTEIYRYDDEAKGLTCVSCDPATEPATADSRLQELRLVNSPMVIHNLTDDGNRVFFESGEALLSDDGDDVNDIYQWSEEGGSGSLALISSGQSVAYPLAETVNNIPAPNLLLSVTPDGEDVVFLSQDALVAGAPEGGATAIYDARVNGGFPPLPEPLLCLEDGCKEPSSGLAPSISLPLSESLHGSGNAKPRRHKHRCRHRRHKKHRACAKHKAKSRRSAAAAASSTASPLGQQGEEVVAGGVVSVTNESTQSASSPSISALATALFDFGIEEAIAALSNNAAARHPDFTTVLSFNHTVDDNGEPRASARVEEVAVSLPPGLLGNPTAIPPCKTGEFVALQCPLDSQVGSTKVLLVGFGEVTEPVFNLVLPHPEREVARLGFTGASFPVYIDVKVRTASDYGATATVYGPSGFVSLVKAETTLWGDPSDASHDKLRMNAGEALLCGGKCPGNESDLPPTAFLTNPSACQSMAIGIGAKSYQLPGQLFTATAPMAPITDCTGLPFSPSFTAEPTSHVAGAPTGLKTKLVLPQHLMAEERATATMREARVTLPEGMQIAAGAANWIGTCSEAQVGYHQEVDTNCPDSSKLGTATIVSPALSVPIEGTIYQRSPQPGHPFGLWLTADALGLHIKLPGSLEPDKASGRLTAVFADLPQVPVEEINLNIWGGPRAPLQNPDHCGSFATDFSFSPHSNDPAATGQSTMTIDQGCDQGFSPTLHAGVTEPVAGKFSPFVFDLTREDGDQALRGFSLHLPDGELAKLKGVPLCGEAAAEAGSCPADSRIGSLRATTGPGPDPLTIPQPGKPEPRIYLSGPYGGSPFSIVSEVPAQAGPFDLGVLAVRSGLDVEPATGRAVVKADPLPRFFEGVGIAYRHLHAVIDRPNFSLNPTDCSEMAVTSDVTSTLGAVAHPQARFQVDGCKRLGFKPKLSLRLRGGTERADYPALTAVLKARKGDANIASTSVALPHSEFLAQEHIATICTRKQFAADKCPKGSVYGRARAWTPLLGKPLAGPVYLRSSDHPLPDLVAKLQGQLEIDLVGRIDSKGGGIRTSFDSVPDAPVSKFVLRMKGGAKGLLTNSTDICRGSHRAALVMRAQNGRRVNARPALTSSGCGRKTNDKDSR